MSNNNKKFELHMHKWVCIGVSQLLELTLKNSDKWVYVLGAESCLELDKI